jgi:hypothetical protein
MKKDLFQQARSGGIRNMLIKKVLILLITTFVIISWECRKGSSEESVFSDSKTNAASSVMKTTKKRFRFGPCDWEVRATSSHSDPGGNDWSSDNAWLDSQNRLHLKLTKNPKTGRWECSEVHSLVDFKYGTYQWKVEGRIDKLDKNVVLGLFNLSDNGSHDEMDVEVSAWGAGSPKLNYTVWPRTGTKGNADNIKWSQSRAFSLTGTFTTHRFVRTAASVSFQSLYGFQDGNKNEFLSAISTKNVSSLSMPIYMNLWLFRGKTPSSNKDIEIIIDDFSFKK